MHAFRLTRTETAPMVTTEPVVAPLIITCDQAEPQQAEVPDTVSDAPTSVSLGRSQLSRSKLNHSILSHSKLSRSKLSRSTLSRSRLNNNKCV
jgi:hypothetical protein